MAQLQAIHDYVAHSSPAYAKRLVDRLTRRSLQIADHPLAGRAVPEVALPQIREVIEGPYRLMYHIRSDRIDVITLIHSAQQTPWENTPR